MKETINAEWLNIMDKNFEKQEHYIKLKSKLNKAVKNKFWFEACMIEYAIIEDRTSSILYYTKICKNAYDSDKKLANKLRSIEYQIGKKHPIISKKVSRDTILKILSWKDKRNDLVHRACVLYNEQLAEDVALEGLSLVKSISNDSAKVTRYVQKSEKNK